MKDKIFYMLIGLLIGLLFGYIGGMIKITSYESMVKLAYDMDKKADAAAKRADDVIDYFENEVIPLLPIDQKEIAEIQLDLKKIKDEEE
jgi:uncharacterized membrane-anchored protein YhcB (DUF1043 family)